MKELQLEQLDLSLRDPEGDLLAAAEVVDGRDLVASATTAVPGVHYVRAAGATPDVRLGNRVTIETDAAPDSESTACAFAAPLVAGEPLPLTPLLPVDVLAVSCGQGFGVDHVATFELAAPAQVSLLVSGDHFGTGLAVRRVCDDVATEVACAAGEVAEIQDLALAAGTWFVVAEVGGGQRPELLLTTP